MKVVIQIGYTKSLGRRKYGQSVQAYINDDQCSFDTSIGQYITSQVESSKGFNWFLWKGEVSSKDIIKLEVKTFMTGIGPDEDRTFETLYYVDENAPVREVLATGIGSRGYPLIKGRILEMGSVSEKDKRDSNLAEFINDEGF